MYTAKGSDMRPVPRAPPLLRGRCGTMCTAKGSDVHPGVPRAPPLLRGRHGAMCAAKGSDVRIGLPRAPPLLRGRRGTMCIAGCFCVAGVGRRGTMYTTKDVCPSIPRVPPLSASFAWVG